MHVRPVPVRLFLQQLTDIQDYDILATELTNVPGGGHIRLLELVVPGLCEGRPSLVKGDYVTVVRNSFSRDGTCIYVNMMCVLPTSYKASYLVC